MPTKSLILVILFAISMLATFAQQTDTFRMYVNHEQKAVERYLAVQQINVFKEKPADELYKIEKYDLFDNILLTKGWAKDNKGTIYQGEYQSFNKNGEMTCSGMYENGKKEGEWKSWHKAGKPETVYNYHEGRLAGLNKSWFESGALQDSIALDNTGTGKAISFYENGGLKSQGNYIHGYKNGTWKYFYNSSANTKSMEAEFDNDSIMVSRCYTETGNLQNGDCIYEQEATFAGGPMAWHNYLIEKLSGENFARYMKRTNRYQVMVRFIVAKDGSISDIIVENPAIKKLDKLAMKIIEKSPAWEPAVLYNQKIKAYRRQPITFALE
ncbi:hypothetical protein BH11BAC4_BH11BAC4_26670 [soil metagenome]